MNTRLSLAAAAALGLFAFTPAANAQVFISADTTINYTINDDVVVGHDSGGNSYNPTVGLVSGGSVSGLLFVFNSSVINLSGGATSDNLNTYDSSTINLSGSSIGYYLNANNSSTVNFSGGSLGANLSAYDSSTINLSGGSIGGDLYASDASAFSITGSGLTDTLVDADVFGYSQYVLDGTLADGTALNGKSLFVQNGTGAAFTFNSVGPSAVPEPGSMALFVGLAGAGGLMLRKRRRISQPGRGLSPYDV